MYVTICKDKSINIKLTKLETIDVGIKIDLAFEFQWRSYITQMFFLVVVGKGADEPLDGWRLSSLIDIYNIGGAA